MTSQALTTTDSSVADIKLVQSGFSAVAAADMAGFAAVFHADATWNHRNDDLLGGIKYGVSAILEFLGQSMELTAGTLRPIPELFMSDGAGHVSVLTRISGTRPDGRTFDDTQVLLFTLEQGLVRSVDQFIGDPTRVTSFWA